MTLAVRRWLLVAAALMAVGTLLPWAWTRSVPWHEVVTVGAFGHGGEWVLAIAALLAAAAVLRRPAAAVILAGLAALFVVYLVWVLPGALLDNGGTYEAGTGLGLDLALLGTFVACCAAAAIVVRAINLAMLESMARRHAARELPPT